MGVLITYQAILNFALCIWIVVIAVKHKKEIEHKQIKIDLLKSSNHRMKSLLDDERISSRTSSYFLIMKLKNKNAKINKLKRKLKSK